MNHTPRPVVRGEHKKGFRSWGDEREELRGRSKGRREG